MKRKSVITSILIFVLVAAAFAASVAAYAFFASSFTQPIGKFTVEIDADKNIVTILNASDLEIWARDDRYRSKAEVSDADSRYVLILGADVTLTKDLFIDRDVSIALNGHTLDTAGYHLTIAHDYAARMVLTAYGRFAEPTGTSGKIVGSGKIYFDTPNGVVVCDDALKADYYDAELNPDGHLIAELNESLVLKEIVRVIDTKIKDGDCFTGDLPMISEVEPYPYKIEWSVPETAARHEISEAGQPSETVVQNVYLTEVGAATLPDAENGGAYSVSMTIGYRIVRKDGTDAQTGQKSVALLSETAAERKIEAGAAFLRDYFAPYRAAGDSETYRLELDLNLVSKLRYFGLKFDYSVLDTATGEDLSDRYLFGSAENGDVTLLYPAAIADVLLKTAITVEYRAGAETVTKVGTADFRFLATDGNNANQAESLLDGFGVLIFKKEGDRKELLKTEDYVLYNIESIGYSFENNNGNYSVSTVENKEGKPADTVVLDKAPGYEEKIYLVLTITFSSGAPKIWSIKTQLYYIDPSMGGGGSEGGDAFAYYHYLVANTLLEKTFTGETYLSFTMPTVWLDSVEVLYILDGDYGAAGAERIKIEPASGQSVKFTVDRSLLGTYNETVKLNFKYREKQADYATGWENIVVYGQKKTEDDVIEGDPISFSFDLSGIYHKGIEIGAELFDILYQTFNKNDLDSEPVLTYAELNDPNVTALSIGGETVISDYKGLRYLIYVASLSIDNAGFGAGTEEELVAMSAIESLSFANASLKNFRFDTLKALKRLRSLSVTGSDLSENSDFNLLTGLETLSLTNCNLTTLSGVFKLVSLKTLRVNDNRIRRFDGLYELKSLKELYIYGNISDDGFGSVGKYNTADLILLGEKGVNVYRALTDGAETKMSYTAEEREYAYAVEAILYRGAESFTGADLSLLLPETLVVGADGNESYTLEYLALGGDAPIRLTFQNGALIVPAAILNTSSIKDGRLEIAVRVTEKNGNPVINEVSRVLSIAIEGGN